MGYSNGIFDQVDVAGSISLAGTLNSGGSFFGEPGLIGKVFTILSSASDLPLVGTFSNTPNNMYANGGNKFLVTYGANVDGGAVGNDVTLTVVAVGIPEPGAAALLLSSASLFLTRRRRRS